LLGLATRGDEPEGVLAVPIVGVLRLLDGVVLDPVCE
jgi:hypothetical protein